MAIVGIGPTCARRGCGRPPWKDALCSRCWCFAELFNKDPRMFAYQPLHGYRGERDAVELPWEHWEREAGAHGGDIVALFADDSRERPTSEE